MSEHEHIAVTVGTTRIVLDLMAELENLNVLPKGHTQVVLRRSVDALRNEGDESPALFIEQSLIPGVKFIV